MICWDTIINYKYRLSCITIKYNSVMGSAAKAATWAIEDSEPCVLKDARLILSKITLWANIDHLKYLRFYIFNIDILILSLWIF